jgi:hypothetical protein
MIYICILYIYIIYNRNWVDTRWQLYSTHLHTNNTQNTENGTYITVKKLNTHNNKKSNNLGSAGSDFLHKISVT